MTISEMEPEWSALPEDEQLRRENGYYLRLMLALASMGNELVVIADTAERQDSRTLQQAGFRPVGPSRFAAPVSAGALQALLNTNPTWVTLVCDGNDVALVADTWDGFYVLVDPDALGEPAE